MGKRLVFSMVISVIVVLVLLLAGCTCGTPATPTTPPVQAPTTPTPAPTPTPTPEPTPTPAPSGETVDEILSQAKSVTSVKYEVVRSFPGATVVPALAMTPMKVWAKGNKMRIETTYQGQTGVNILDADTKTAYVYLPAENMAMKQPFPPPTTGDPALFALMHPADSMEWIADGKPLVTGSETVDGKECLVAEITTEQAKWKVWIWKEYGIPIRMEAPNPHGGTIVTEWKNVEVVNIPDSMFELPSGVEIKEQ